MQITIDDVSKTETTQSLPPKSSLTDIMLGNYVLIRSVNEGINAGWLEAADDTGVVLRDARRLWYFEPQDKSTSWYEGVSLSGLALTSKVSNAVPHKIIIEDYSITECSDVAIKSIIEFKANEQT